MGTMSTQQVTGWLGMGVAAAVAVVGLMGGASAGPAGVEAAGGQAESLEAPTARDSFVSLLPGDDGVRTYAVGPGDTLSGIAAAHGTTAEAIAEGNGLDVDAPLALGQVLRVPMQAAE